MEEKITNEVVEEQIVGEEVLSEEVAENAGEIPADAKPKKKSIKAIIEYIKSHEDLRQAVMFMMFSLLCCAAQTAVQFILKYAIGAANDSPFSWFIFIYDAPGGLAEFIGFICGSFVGQVLTFVLNRKKTFKATNNVVIAGLMYAVIAVCIVILQTYLGLLTSAACTNAAIANGTEITDFIGLLITITGMAVGGLTALILSFVGNKYLVMRDWGKKKKAIDTKADEVVSTDEVASQEETPVEE